MKLNPGMNFSSVRLMSLVASLSGFVGACGQEVPVEQAEVARPIKMISIGEGVGSRTLEVPGSVSAAQSADLSFEVSGRMLARIVEEGQVVEAGEVVAKLDPRDYVAQRNAARARRDTAKADYDRYTKAFEKNAVTEQQVTRSKGYFEITQAELDVADKALQDTELRAPFGGRIARRLIDDFANVRQKEPVLVLQDESSLELRVAVAERDWVRGESDISRDEYAVYISIVVDNNRLPRTGRQTAGGITDLAAQLIPHLRQSLCVVVVFNGNRQRRETTIRLGLHSVELTKLLNRYLQVIRNLLLDLLRRCARIRCHYERNLDRKFRIFEPAHLFERGKTRCQHDDRQCKRNDPILDGDSC